MNTFKVFSGDHLLPHNPFRFILSQGRTDVGVRAHRMESLHKLVYQPEKWKNSKRGTSDARLGRPFEAVQDCPLFPTTGSNTCDEAN